MSWGGWMAGRRCTRRVQRCTRHTVTGTPLSVSRVMMRDGGQLPNHQRCGREDATVGPASFRTGDLNAQLGWLGRAAARGCRATDRVVGVGQTSITGAVGRPAHRLARWGLGNCHRDALAEARQIARTGRSAATGVRLVRAGQSGSNVPKKSRRSIYWDFGRAIDAASWPADGFDVPPISAAGDPHESPSAARSARAEFAVAAFKVHCVWRGTAVELASVLIQITGSVGKLSTRTGGYRADGRRVVRRRIVR